MLKEDTIAEKFAEPKFAEPELAEPDIDVLTEGWLHKLMVAYHAPEKWPAWGMVLFGAIMTALAAVPWYLALDAPTALIIAGMQALFFMGDTAVLRALPKKRISFGPWKAQLAVLSTPRLLATLGLSLVGWQWGAQWGIGLTALIQLAATAAFIWGGVIEPFRLKLSEIVMFSNQLPPDASPIRILHISDLHIERLTRREEKVLALAAETKPDVILITGDYVNLSYNQDPETHAQVRQLLSQLSAPYGVYATLGSPPVDLREEVVPIFEGLPIHLMRYGWKRIDLDEGRELVLVGMDCTHHLPTDQARLHNLMADAPNGAPQALFYHSPELMPQAIEHGIDLYVCGHTHGGQVRLPIIGPILTSSQLGRKYVMGLYRNGRTHLYVSRGIGLEGLSAPRVRFLAPPEMTLITMMPISES
ncbi:MAG: hypothetical protein GY803_20800 [Chloroflexi bacterium]|nr:hypothetical protein [Chloroflexota bacterium]